jgi:hypothetical protein
MFKKMVSSIGKQTCEIVVAFRWGWQSVDVDSVVEKIEGKSTPVEEPQVQPSVESI